MSHVFGAGRKDADGDAVLVAERRQEPPLQLQPGQTRPVEPRVADSRRPQGENSFPRRSAYQEVTAERQSVLGNTLLTSTLLSGASLKKCEIQSGSIYWLPNIAGQCLN